MIGSLLHHHHKSNSSRLFFTMSRDFRKQTLFLSSPFYNVSLFIAGERPAGARGWAGCGDRAVSAAAAVAAAYR